MIRRATSDFQIRKASAQDAERVLELFRSVAMWLETNGPGRLWASSSFVLSDVEERIERSNVIVLQADGEIAACMYVEDFDDNFWPEAILGDAFYVHKLAVDRRFSGHGLARLLLDWAVEHARASNRRFLRLDCAPREKLVGVYTSAGFYRVGDDKMIDGFLVARLERAV